MLETVLARDIDIMTPYKFLGAPSQLFQMARKGVNAGDIVKALGCHVEATKEGDADLVP